MVYLPEPLIQPIRGFTQTHKEGAPRRPFEAEVVAGARTTREAHEPMVRRPLVLIANLEHHFQLPSAPSY